MIVVLDTNVIVSALLSATGAPAEIMRRWEANAFEVVISPQMLDELENALHYPRVSRYIRFSKEQMRAFLNGFAMVATLVEPEDLPEVIHADPADDKVLACALAGKADYVISGDRHLLHLREFQGVVILPPAGFVMLLDLENKG